MQNSTKKVVLVGCSVFGFFGILAVGAVVWLLIGAAESIHGYSTGGYQVSLGKVYFYQEASGYSTVGQSWEIKEADAASFEVLENGYAKDKKYAYGGGYVLSQSDGKTFKIIRSGYAADQNHVFYGTRLLSNSPDKFRILEKYYSADDEKVFIEGKDFLLGTVDAATFEQVGSSEFFRDKNRVYMENKIVEGADSATFEKISEPKINSGSARDFYYAKDKTSIFYQGVKVAGCDPKTHKIIDFRTHRDARHLYLSTKKISDDPDHFEELEGDFYKDSVNVYWKTKKIGADPATFQLLSDGSGGVGFARDAKNVYWCDLKVERADAASFVALGDNYGKDKNSVWYARYENEPAFIVENADVATFETYINEFRTDGRDKNNYFEFGKITKARP